MRSFVILTSEVYCSQKTKLSVKIYILYTASKIFRKQNMSCRWFQDFLSTEWPWRQGEKRPIWIKIRFFDQYNFLKQSLTAETTFATLARQWRPLGGDVTKDAAHKELPRPRPSVTRYRKLGTADTLLTENHLAKEKHSEKQTRKAYITNQHASILFGKFVLCIVLCCLSVMPLL